MRELAIAEGPADKKKDDEPDSVNLKSIKKKEDPAL